MTRLVHAGGLWADMGPAYRRGLRDSSIGCAAALIATGVWNVVEWIANG